MLPQFSFNIEHVESDLTFIGIHFAFVFFLFLSLYMAYLRPETRLEKAVHFKAICLTLVLIRVIQYRYVPGFQQAEWYGAFAWLSLSASFIYTMYAISRTAFGRKGRKKVRERLFFYAENKGNSPR